MHANEISVWLKGFALLVLLSVSTSSVALAQTPQSLETTLVPGSTVWITDAAGREEKMRILGVTGGIVTAIAGADTRRLPTTDVTRVRVPDSDALWNGALLGAGVAVATGLALCRLTEPWENCRDDVGPMLRIGAIGAGVGIGIDALVRGRRTIYEAGRPSAQLHAAPIIGGHAAGLQFSIRF